MNTSRKAIGAFVSLAVLAGVLYVTVVSQSPKTQPVAEQNNAQAQNIVTGEQDVAVNSQPVQPSTLKTETKKNNFQEDGDFDYDGEDEDDDRGGKLPITTTQTPPPVTTTKPTTVSASAYKDGTYSATGSYMSPGGQDMIGVTVTLSKGVVTKVSANPQPGDRTSSRYMDKFMSGYETMVVGKSIADLHLTKVSGASLTPIGFNDAISQIKTKAKA